jgi:hypothetical protein
LVFSQFACTSFHLLKELLVFLDASPEIFVLFFQLLNTGFQLNKIKDIFLGLLKNHLPLAFLGSHG